jgi:hypothetical protein
MSQPGGGFSFFFGERGEILWRSRNAIGTRLTHAAYHLPDIVQKVVPYQGTSSLNQSLTASAIGASSIVPSKALVFSMESLAMRNRLQVSFWGLHLSADGIFAIVAALVIVIAILVASRL